MCDWWTGLLSGLIILTERCVYSLGEQTRCAYLSRRHAEAYETSHQKRLLTSKWVIKQATYCASGMCKRRLQTVCLQARCKIWCCCHVIFFKVKLQKGLYLFPCNAPHVQWTQRPDAFITTNRLVCLVCLRSNRPSITLLQHFTAETVPQHVIYFSGVATTPHFRHYCLSHVWMWLWLY